MTPCAVPWPVCPHCPGVGLSSSAGLSTCPHCRRTWPESERDPCPDAATVLLAAGGTLLVCASHAAHPSARDLRRVPEPT